MNNKVLWDLVNSEIDKALNERFKTKGARKLAYRVHGLAHLIDTIYVPTATKVRNEFYNRGLVETAMVIDEMIAEWVVISERDKK